MEFCSVPFDERQRLGEPNKLLFDFQAKTKILVKKILFFSKNF